MKQKLDFEKKNPPNLTVWLICGGNLSKHLLGEKIEKTFRVEIWPMHGDCIL